jgi:hypothetical protein
MRFYFLPFILHIPATSFLSFDNPKFFYLLYINNIRYIIIIIIIIIITTTICIPCVKEDFALMHCSLLIFTLNLCYVLSFPKL